MRAHSENAMRLASFLAEHPAVEWVSYPGLESHPQHEVARRLLGERFGGMMSMRLKGGTAEMNRFANRLKLCDLGVSLGDVYTLVYPQPRRDNLIRISTGCEDIDDILADFRQALEWGLGSGE
jgi:cystathionine beta-lyase/cystathionine gamma-synthase